MKTSANDKKKSLMAVNLANDVINHIREKKPINLKALHVRNGYTLDSAIAQKGVKTKTYQRMVVPVVEQMRALHEKAIKNLASRDLDAEKMDSVVNLSKQMMHDSQLLSGHATENVASNIVAYGSEDFLALQENKHIGGTN